jgi:heptosyltransferase-2
MCLPALEALKTLHPEAQITVLAKPVALPVFENNPSLAELLEYDSGGRHKGVLGKLRLAGEIKEKRFDMAVLFQNAFEAALLTFLARIPVRAGYARDFRRPLLTKAVPYTVSIRNFHHVVYYLNLVRELGGKVPENPAPSIPLKPEEIERARVYLAEKGFSDTDTLIGCAPGASYGPAKRWPPERFIEALERLAEELAAVPVIFGGSGDMEASSKVSGGLTTRGVKHLDLTARTGLREFMALLALLKLFISNDSGAMHVAAALAIPTVAVFGSTDPSLTGPFGSSVAVLTENLECSPCFKRECDNTGASLYECLTSVKTGDVVRAARALVAEVV